MVTMKGNLTIIYGPMYASKTTTMLGKLLSEAAIGMKVLYINHNTDSREIEGVKSDKFTTHNLMYRKASETMTIQSKENMTFMKVDTLPTLKEIEEYQTIGIDEYQFFDRSNNDLVISYVDSGKIVFVCGLSSDFNRHKFGGILDLIVHADEVIHLTAFCEKCSEKGIRNKAIYTLKTITDFDSSDVVNAGAKDKYLPVCRSCYLSDML